MIAAGIGCRRGCPADDIVAAIRAAAAQSGCRIEALAAPEFKRHEPGLQAAASRLGLPVHYVTRDAMARAQPGCVTHSAIALHATGIGSVAEGAALAAAGAPLRLPRIAHGAATCAIAGAT